MRVPKPTFSLDFGQIPIGGFEHGKSSLQAAAAYERDASLVTNTVFQGIVAEVPLLDARLAGVRGVICVWTGMSDDQVANQYNPITTKYPNKEGCPCRMTADAPRCGSVISTGRSLADSAAIGKPKVTLHSTA